MKRQTRLISVLTLCFCLIFIFCACGKTEVEKSEPVNSNQTTKESPKYELESGQNIHTIAFISDTQKYSESKSDVFMAMIKSLVDDREKYNIEYVIHSGDLVQHADKDEQWQVARKAMSQLDSVIPYGVLSGNHDQDIGENRFTAYSKYFGDSSYDKFEYFGGSYADCRAHYQLVTIGSTDFVVVFIGDDPDLKCIDFANEAFAKYPERVGILCTHKYMEPDLSLDEMGEYMSEKIVAKNDNVYMVLCGHESAAGYLETEVNGRKVVQIMANYQDAHNDGTLMYLQLDEGKGTLTGISYSPITKSYDGYTGQDNDQFQIAIPWSK